MYPGRCGGSPEALEHLQWPGWAVRRSRRRVAGMLPAGKDSTWEVLDL